MGLMVGKSLWSKWIKTNLLKQCSFWEVKLLGSEYKNLKWVLDVEKAVEA